MSSQSTPAVSTLELASHTTTVNNNFSATPTLCDDANIKEKLEASSAISVASESENQTLTGSRKAMILVILCTAQFFDIFNACAAIVSLPKIAEDLKFTPGSVTWILSGYTLTFAAFMLIAGRLADMYHPKPIFSAGFLVIGLLSIPIGFSVNPIMAVIFRALQGIGAAMNVPSAMALISITFTDPAEVSRAYAIYGAFGAIGNVAGLVIGGVLTARASWRWVFYLLAIVMSPVAVISWFVLPPHKKNASETRRTIDWPGVFTLTSGLVLFVFAITEGSAVGWGSVRVVTTLVLSVVLLAAFFVIERIVKDPAFPPRTWSNKNFTPLFFYAWSIYWFVYVIEMHLVNIFTTLWMDSALIAAVRCIPLGITAGISAPIVGVFAPRIPRRALLLLGQILPAISVILFALADTPDKYWSHIVPGMIIGMIGVALSYVGTTVVMMEGARPGEEGVVGAMMNTAFQIGATVGLAIATSITLGVNKKLPLDSISQHRGYAISFWSLLAMQGLMIISTFLFVRN